MQFSDEDLYYTREVQHVRPFYLQNQAGLFLTSDDKERQITVQEQDFSKNQTWFLSHSSRDWAKYYNNATSEEFGTLFCGNGTCLSTQGGEISVESDFTDQDNGHLKFYFHEIGWHTFYIAKCEDKIKTFEGDEKQDFLAIIEGRIYMGSIEDALTDSEEDPTKPFTWQKVDPSGSSKIDNYKGCIYQWATIYPEEQLPSDEQFLPLSQLPKYAFAAGEESGDQVFLGKRGRHVGKVLNEIKYLGFHHEDAPRCCRCFQDDDHRRANEVKILSNTYGDAIDVLCINPEAEVDWVDYEDEQLPMCPVIACLSDGIYYVGKGTINNDTIPGIFLHKKIKSEQRGQCECPRAEANEHTLYAVFDGKIQELKKFKVLVASKHIPEENKGT